MPSEETEMTTLAPDDETTPPSPGQSLLRPGNHRVRQSSGKEQQMRLRLLALTFIAFLALTSIAVILQQLYYKHFGGPADFRAGGPQANGTRLLLAQNFTRNPLRAHMLRHVNRTRGVTATEEDYDYYGSPPKDIILEVADRLVDQYGYWSSVVESYLASPDPTLERAENQVQTMREQTIVHLEQGDDKRCAGSQNGFVLFQEGLAGCVRYREPHQQLVLGELLSYHLSRLLGMRTVPPAVLSQVGKQFSGFIYEYFLIFLDPNLALCLIK
jgi:hypothetical protein